MKSCIIEVTYFYITLDVGQTVRNDDMGKTKCTNSALIPLLHRLDEVTKLPKRRAFTPES